MTWITIYSDASYHHDKQTGMFAFYLKTSDITFKKSGQLPSTIKNIVEAEMYAICNALHYAHSMNIKAVGVTINTDSKSAMSFFTRDINKCSGGYLKLRKLFDQNCISVCQGRNVKIKHVKAHTGNKDTRSYLNNLCDKLARLK